MANYAEGVNPQVLRWAREKAGYSVAEVATSFDKDEAEINSWENGSSVPTYIQLERLAYTLYKRPIALFFFPGPPPEPDLQESFRTLPDFEFRKLGPDSLHAVREAHAMQYSLRELAHGTNPAPRLIFRDIEVASTVSPQIVADRVRDYLGVTLADQINWSGTSAALKAWRTAVQDAGVFVFKRAFKQNDISGFCLVDEEFPVIYLNNSSAKSRQSFSLFHELAHVLLRTSGVTKIDDSFISMLQGEDKAIEVFCNRFAAEVLVPAEDLQRHTVQDKPVEELVEDLAKRYHVSREVILRKLLDRKQVSQTYYETKAHEWIDDFEKSKKGSGTGGNYYANQATYLGEAYLKLAFRRFNDGDVTIQQVADYLNIRVKSVEGLENFFLKQAAA